MSRAPRPLTPFTIKNLKPKADRYEVPDPGQRGLLVVVFPSGKQSFIVRYRSGGVKKKLTLGGISLAAARKSAADALYAVSEGRDPVEAKKAAKEKAAGAAANTVEAVLVDYLKREATPNLRTSDDREQAFERLVYPAIGSQQIHTLKRSQIVKLLDKIEDENGARMADLVLAYLRKAFNWYAVRDEEFKSPIVKGMGRYNSEAGRGPHKFSDDEIKALWAATKPDPTNPKPFAAFVRFLLLTGARRSEAAGLTWAEIDGADWLLPASRNKVKVDLVRPLSKAAQAVIAAQPRIDGGPFVFTNDGHHQLAFSKAKKSFDDACGVKGWVLHDLRRAARTLMSAAGVDADVAERCLGHVIGGVRGKYDLHEFYDEKKKAFEALAAQIESIVNPPKGNVVKLRRRTRSPS
jgi:integrase